MTPRCSLPGDTRNLTAKGEPSGSPSSFRWKTLTVIRLPHGNGEVEPLPVTDEPCVRIGVSRSPLIRRSGG